MLWCKSWRVLLGGALALLTLSAQANLRDDTVRLDQVMIPALVLCAQGDSACEPGIGAVLPVWERFKQDQAYRPDHGSQWNFDINDIERAVLAAKRWSDQGEYRRAYQALEPARTLLMRMRERVGLDYYPDSLLAFQSSLEELGAMVKRLDGQSGAGGWDAVARVYANLMQRWQTVRDWPLNSYQYGLDFRRAKRLRDCLASEQRHLDAFGKSLARQDQHGASTDLAALHKGFDDIYRLFGRFPANDRN